MVNINSPDLAAVLLYSYVSFEVLAIVYVRILFFWVGRCILSSSSVVEFEISKKNVAVDGSELYLIAVVYLQTSHCVVFEKPVQ
jgi:hypothetical protein